MSPVSPSGSNSPIVLFCRSIVGVNEATPSPLQTQLRTGRVESDERFPLHRGGVRGRLLLTGIPFEIVRTFMISIFVFSQIFVWYFDFGKSYLAILVLSYSILIVTQSYSCNSVF